MNNNNSLSKEEQCLLHLLSVSLKMPSVMSTHSPMGAFDEINTDQVIRMAKKHNVLSLLYPVLENTPAFFEKMSEVSENAKKVVFQSYRLLFLDKYLLEEFENAGIPIVILKGMATAYYYPQPELRKSGDVDLLLLDITRLKEAVKCMESLGFTKAKQQPALHHVVFFSREGIEIELHTNLAEPFDNDKTNRYLTALYAQCIHHVVQKRFLNITISQLDVPFHGFELLLHMLQHFLRSGFGLKLLCDWVVFWNQETTGEDRERYLSLVRGAGLKGFSDMITIVCCHYLGLKEEMLAFMEIPRMSFKEDVYKEELDFLKEILKAEEFGKTSNTRMVALRGGGVKDYIRELHHQMRLNFPKSGKCFLFWPVLWTITFIRFLVNNRRVRNVSLWDVLKTAGHRGRLVEKLELFRKE